MIALPRRGLISLAAALSLLGCEQKQEAAPSVPFEAAPSAETATVDRHTQEAWHQGISLAQASMAQARRLHNAVEALLNAPGEDTLSSAREAWHQSHNAYLALELFTALSSSNPGLFASLGEYDFAIEAWPIQPGYLDYFDVYLHSGIVNDMAMPLTAEAVRQQHGLTDTADVSLGFHALEYLLWGEDGQRAASDYEESDLSPEQAATDLREVDLPNNRRRVYLQLLTNLLLDDLEGYKNALEDTNGLLRRSYSALHPYSRLVLFEAAAQAMLSHHRDLLQAQLEQDMMNGDGAAAFIELQHSPFAGSDAQPLLRSLATLKQVLLNSESGLGEWLNQTGEDTNTGELLSELEDRLQALEEERWPPTGEVGAELVSALTQLSERFEPRDRAHLKR